MKKFSDQAYIGGRDINMLSFRDYLEEYEELEEGKLTKALGALTVTAASLLGGEPHAAEFNRPAAQSSINIQNPKSLRDVYNLLKKQHEEGERSDIAVYYLKMKELAPEYYGPQGSDTIKIGELAGMQEDAFAAFLDRMHDNVAEQERMAKMPITKWTDRNGGVTFKARYLKFDSHGDNQGANGSVWFQKEDGQKIKVPFRWLSMKNQQQVQSMDQLNIRIN